MQYFLQPSLSSALLIPNIKKNISIHVSPSISKRDHFSNDFFSVKELLLKACNNLVLMENIFPYMKLALNLSCFPYFAYYYFFTQLFNIYKTTCYKQQNIPTINHLIKCCLHFSVKLKFWYDHYAKPLNSIIDQNLSQYFNSF